ncbi:MAG: hypothetical protein ACI8P0_003573 [Planctomycetaceae bacterium]|jgi:hypothetical protein
MTEERAQNEFPHVQSRDISLRRKDGDRLFTPIGKLLRSRILSFFRVQSGDVDMPVEMGRSDSQAI